MTTFKASEVREKAAAFCDDCIMPPHTTGQMLAAYADRLEADEKVVPVGWRYFDGGVGYQYFDGAPYAVGAGIELLYLHPAPADAERLSEALRELVVACEEHDAMVSRIIGHPPAASVPDGLVDALRHQRQIDEDGAEVGVSRQAVDEAANILAMLAAQENPNG